MTLSARRSTCVLTLVTSRSRSVPPPSAAAESGKHHQPFWFWTPSLPASSRARRRLASRDGLTQMSPPGSIVSSASLAFRTRCSASCRRTVTG